MNDTLFPAALRAWLASGSLNIFGTPFAGKDTQGERLSRALGAPLIGGGDILRNSVIPDPVKAVMHRGELIPIEDYLRIVLPYLSKPEFSGKPLVLSSVGRWHGEEFGVLEALKQSEHPLRAVVFLHLDERIVWRRWEDSLGHDLRGKRHDDAAEAVQVRLEEFRVKTAPVVAFYRDLGLLEEIDGEQPKDDVTAAIAEALSRRAGLNL